MPIEEMTVVNACADSVQVSTRNLSHCAGCKARSGCGLHLLNRQESFSLPVQPAWSQQLQAGDKLTVAIDDVRLIQLSFLQYLFPVAIVLAVTAVVEKIVTTVDAGEFWVISGAFFALIIGLLFTPQLVKRLADNPGRLLKVEFGEATGVAPTHGKQEG